MSTPTNEQIKKWRKEFEIPFPYAWSSGGEYISPRVRDEWKGYLRRCQETEQALTPITADDVTDEMMADLPMNLDILNLDSTKQDVADIFNAVIKHMSEA